MTVIHEAIPQEMRDLTNWVVWRYETRGGKATKVPYNPRNARQKASASDPATWGTFTEAHALIGRHGVEGIGFQFGGTPYCGIDTDHKQHDGDMHPIAADIITRLDSYSEISPSGKGQHIIIRGHHPEWAKHKQQLAPDLEVEVYSEGRFFTITGNVIQSPYIEERQETLEALLRAWGMEKPVTPVREAATGQTGAFTGSDADLWERIFKSANGGAVRALADGDLTQHGNDRSRADFALCGHLCFWTNGDPARMDSMFRTSGLMRPKWDTKHRSDGTTYGQMTIQEVLARWDGSGYDPAVKRELKQVTRIPWTSPELLIRGRQHLATSGSHGRTVDSFAALWHAVITVITAGHTTEQDGTLTLTAYGMTELYAHAGGRPMDRRQQLGFLHGQGMVGPLIRQDASNPRSAWLLTMPANPGELPFSTAPRGSLPPLPLNAKPRPKQQAGGNRYVIKSYERERYESRFFPVWIVFAASILSLSTVDEISDLSGQSPRTVKRHLPRFPLLIEPQGRTKDRRWKSVLTPEQVGALYLHLTAPDVERRKRRILEDRLVFHEQKFSYLTSHGLHSQAAVHFQYAEKYRKHLEAA